MKFLKNLLALFLIAIAPVSASDSDTSFRIEVNGDIVSAYADAPKLWEVTLPKDFPRDCITNTQEHTGKPFTCAPVEKLISTRFDWEALAVLETVKRITYTVTITNAGATVESQAATPVFRKNSRGTLPMVWVVAIGIAIASFMNGWTLRDQRRIFVFYASILGTIAFAWLVGVLAGGLVGVLAGGLVGVLAGGLAGGLVGELAGGFAGGFAGELAGMFAGGVAGGFTGGFTGTYGWVATGVTEYLIFIGLVCAASFVLRVIATFFAKRMKKPSTATEA